MTNKIFLILLAWGLLFFSASCSNDDVLDYAHEERTCFDGDSIKLTLIVQDKDSLARKDFVQGENVLFNFRIENKSHHSIVKPDFESELFTVYSSIGKKIGNPCENYVFYDILEYLSPNGGVCDWLVPWLKGDLAYVKWPFSLAGEKTLPLSSGSYYVAVSVNLKENGGVQLLTANFNIK